MRLKVVSGMMLTLLLIGMLTLAFNIGLVEAETYYYNFNITVTPEFPSTLDEINMTVSFATASISYEVTFGPVSQVSNEFSVDIDIYVPEGVFWALGYASHTYSLGKLPAGSYSFVATVRVSGYGYGVYEHRKSFAVSPVVPEFPSFLILPLFMIATLLAAIVYRRKRTTNS